MVRHVRVLQVVLFGFFLLRLQLWSKVNPHATEPYILPTLP